MNRRLQVAKYVLSDLIVQAWHGPVLVYRKSIWSRSDRFSAITFDEKLFQGLALIPLFWFGLYMGCGGYKEIFRGQDKGIRADIVISLIGVTMIFFVCCWMMKLQAINSITDRILPYSYCISR